MKVGFIGLGQMGRGMAADLLKAGHEVAVFNRTAGNVAAQPQSAGDRPRSVFSGMIFGVRRRRIANIPNGRSEDRR